MKATVNGSLTDIFECYIIVGDEIIVMNNLPEISDTKSATYSNEAIMGRSFPLYTYSHSNERTITMQLHFFVVDEEDVQENLDNLRILQSAVYPREGGAIGTPFTPPVVCRIKCGQLLATEELCCVLQNYNVKFPTDVAWATNGTSEASVFTPFRFDVDTTWQVVYSSNNLPYNSRIITSGR